MRAFSALALLALAGLCGAAGDGESRDVTGQFAYVTILYGDADGVIASNLLATRVRLHAAVPSRPAPDL